MIGFSPREKVPSEKVQAYSTMPPSSDASALNSTVSGAGPELKSDVGAHKGGCPTMSEVRNQDRVVG